MNTLFFSVIIPILNEEKALPFLLQDLLEQTYRSFEVIVVDAHSSDSSAEIANSFALRLPSFTLESSKEHNVSIQRNKGAASSQGEWLLFLDADTRIERTFLKEMKQQLEAAPCDAGNPYARPDSTDIASKLYISLQNHLLETMVAMQIPYAIGACFLCKRVVFQKTGGFNPTIHHMEDSELARRIHDQGFVFRIFKHPFFTYSLRRQRKEGTLKFVSTHFPYYLRSFITKEYRTPKKLYPMTGGKAFSRQRRNGKSHAEEAVSQ